MPQLAVIDITAIRADGFRKRIATLSEEQILMSCEGVDKASCEELSDIYCGGLHVTIDPAKYIGCRFILSVRPIQD